MRVEKKKRDKANIPDLLLMWRREQLLLMTALKRGVEKRQLELR